MPKVLQSFIDEMLGATNLSFKLYSELSRGAYHLLDHAASEEIRDRYLPKLVEGVWSGSMCLTEPHCGTDLAGYMRLLSPWFVKRFPDRILNIHPSLLPAFPGLHAQRQALTHGVKITGCTVHLVDEHLDAGPIILQSAVPVQDNDDEETLSARILKQEHILYPKALSLVCEGRVEVKNTQA